MTTRDELFDFAVAAMKRGDFTALETRLGGPAAFDKAVIGWYEQGLFENEQNTLNEIFTAACMLGHYRTAGYLLDQGVDPYAGMSCGLSGFHFAASGAKIDVIKLLIDRKVPMEVRNLYGGTVLDQALWSAVNENQPKHTLVIEMLLDAGAAIEPGTIEWWEEQPVSSETKQRVAAALRTAQAK